MKVNAVNSPGMALNSGGKAVEPAINDAASQEGNSATTQESNDQNDIDAAKLQKKVDELNKKAEAAKYNVRFAIHQATDRTMIEVVDTTNDNKVISTFPPKQILDLAAMVDKQFSLINKKI